MNKCFASCECSIRCDIYLHWYLYIYIYHIMLLIPVTFRSITVNGSTYAWCKLWIQRVQIRAWYIGGSRGRRRPPQNGTQFFCFRIRFCWKAPASEVSTPHGPAPTNGKSWIRYCNVHPLESEWIVDLKIFTTYLFRLLYRIFLSHSRWHCRKIKFWLSLYGNLFVQRWY